jgi:hypothetical protein
MLVGRGHKASTCLLRSILVLREWLVLVAWWQNVSMQTRWNIVLFENIELPRVDMHRADRSAKICPRYTLTLREARHVRLHADVRFSAF